MKRWRNNLDEMQEQKLKQIEHTGFWLFFWGLFAAIMVQSVFLTDMLPHELRDKDVVRGAFRLHGAHFQTGAVPRHGVGVGGVGVGGVGSGSGSGVGAAVIVNVPFTNVIV